MMCTQSYDNCQDFADQPPDDSDHNNDDTEQGGYMPFDVRTQSWETPFFLAAQHGRCEVCEKFVPKKCDLCGLLGAIAFALPSFDVLV